MGLVRVSGWEHRLVNVIESARNRRYKIGEHDCFTFACEAVWALTGVDLYLPWKGKYKSMKEARRLINEYSGEGHTQSGNKLFGTVPVGMSLARRGDIATFSSMGRCHLGVCTGSHVATPSKISLMFLRLDDCDFVWRIG